jgi:HD-GYP domain-containing protein (c-di-GMP phosphodiesterase class II)
MEAEVELQQLEKEMVRLGKTLVVHLFVLLKTAQNYNEGHGALRSPVGNILGVIGEIHRRNEESSIRAQGGHLFLGEVRLKPDSSAVDPFLFIFDLLKRYGIGGIQFAVTVTPQEIMRFAYVLKEVEPLPYPPDVYIQVIGLLHNKGITSISTEPFVEEGEAEPSDDEAGEDPKAKAKKIYLHTVVAVSEVMDNAKMGQTLRLRKSKRVVQTMIDQLLAAESNLLGLTTIRSHDEYTYHHSVNVCILSLAMGQRIGFSKARLFELGIAGLFHDIGKAEIPEEILNKPTEFSPEEWEVVHRHPTFGVRKLMKLKGLDILTSRIVTGAYEHHMNCDLSGYPKYPYRRLSLFGRIISIADCYDALTSSRVYNRVPFPPDKALRFMLDRAGTAYDALLMKVFVNCIGIFPIGTLVRLSSNQLGVVVGNSGDPDRWDRPTVRIISTIKGEETDGGVIDLGSGDISITQTLDPYRYRLDPSLYFL